MERAFSLEEFLEFLDSLCSLESLKMVGFSFCFPQAGGSLESLETINSREFLDDPFPRRPLFKKTLFFRTGKSFFKDLRLQNVILAKNHTTV